MPTNDDVQLLYSLRVMCVSMLLICLTATQMDAIYLED